MVTRNYWTNIRPLGEGLFEVSWPNFQNASAVIEAPDVDEALRCALQPLISLVIGKLQAARD